MTSTALNWVTSSDRCDPQTPRTWRQAPVPDQVVWIWSALQFLVRALSISKCHVLITPLCSLREPSTNIPAELTSKFDQQVSARAANTVSLLVRQFAGDRKSKKGSDSSSSLSSSSSSSTSSSAASHSHSFQRYSSLEVQKIMDRRKRSRGRIQYKIQLWVCLLCISLLRHVKSSECAWYALGQCEQADALA